MDRKKWDFWLVIITVILLFSLAFISLVGTFYSWVKSVSKPEWTKGFEYVSYLKKMNLAAAPFALGILAVLGLCIPKRLAKVFYLVLLTLASVGVFFAASLLLSWKSGLIIFILLLSAIQIVYIFLYFSARGIFLFEKKGFCNQLGSLLLHLGFTLLILELILGEVLLKFISLFWATFFIILLGLVFTFFSEEISKLLSSES
jgi:hypothetical protein